MSELSEGGVCEHCNVSDCFHDRDHLATECYPKQIDALTQRVADMTRALEAVYACLNNRILGSGGDPSINWHLREQCEKACEQARAALASGESK